MRRGNGAQLIFARHRTARPCFARRPAVLFSLALVLLVEASGAFARPTSQTRGESTPLQREIQAQAARLSSAAVEERRDAVTRLGALRRPESSRAAAAALGDAAAIVRATAARAVLSLGPGEASTLVLPLLRDREEFVRREAAYALGLTRSKEGVPGLVIALETDKKPSVRGAAAVALGQIGDASAAAALMGALSRQLKATGFLNRVRRRKIEEDEFVRRAAAVSLGQLGSREAVPELVETLSSERTPGDVRREAARALGLIGDPSAVFALRAALTAQDPYLSRIAFEALCKIDPSGANRPAL